MLACNVYICFFEFIIKKVGTMCSYQSTLKQLFQEFGSSGDESHSQLATVTMRIMQALQTNLDAKSKQYKDQALTYLFLMNNIHYMVRSVRRYMSHFFPLYPIDPNKEMGFKMIS
jgi:Exo70 exocyst complex subunit